MKVWVLERDLGWDGRTDTRLFHTKAQAVEALGEFDRAEAELVWPGSETTEAWKGHDRWLIYPRVVEGAPQ